MKELTLITLLLGNIEQDEQMSYCSNWYKDVNIKLTLFKNMQYELINYLNFHGERLVIFEKGI